MYNRARYYDPATGEFISRDPLEYVDGMSLYRGYFAPGDMDPSGLVCSDNGGEYQYISGRGNFFSFELTDFNEHLRSRFYGAWDPDEEKFEEDPGCPCCTKIGTVQIAKSIKVIRRPHRDGGSPYIPNPFNAFNEWVNQHDWELDGGYPYQEEGTADRTPDPTTAQLMVHHDVPGDYIWNWGLGSVEYLSQNFEFCIVCLDGTEKNAVYGCAKWGHEFRYSGRNQRTFFPRLTDYGIRRYINLVGSFIEFEQTSGLDRAGSAPSPSMLNILGQVQP